MRAPEGMERLAGIPAAGRFENRTGLVFMAEGNDLRHMPDRARNRPQIRMIKRNLSGEIYLNRAATEGSRNR